MTASTQPQRTSVWRDAARPKKSQQEKLMKLIGYILLGIGAVVALAAFGTDTAPEGTHNIGLDVLP